MRKMNVVKRDGHQEAFCLDKIMWRLRKLTYGLSNLHCDPILVAKNLRAHIYNDITTAQIDELAAETASALTATHPHYACLAARIAVSNLHKSTTKSFSETVKAIYSNVDVRTGLTAPFIADDVYELIMKNAARLDSEIIYGRDFDCDYCDLKILERRSLIKIQGKVVERPQHMFMRVAIGIHKHDIESAVQRYHLMSQQWSIHASPALFNSRAPPQNVEDDIDGKTNVLCSAINICDTDTPVSEFIDFICAAQIPSSQPHEEGESSRPTESGAIIKGKSPELSDDLPVRPQRPLLFYSRKKGRNSAP